MSLYVCVRADLPCCIARHSVLYCSASIRLGDYGPMCKQAMNTECVMLAWRIFYAQNTSTHIPSDTTRIVCVVNRKKKEQSMHLPDSINCYIRNWEKCYLAHFQNNHVPMHGPKSRHINARAHMILTLHEEHISNNTHTHTRKMQSKMSSQTFIRARRASQRRWRANSTQKL